ncbi:MAG TPA: AlkA N-terminal domain-containing protein [Bryobacteraceae bacterium]|nr:AlkA N-terminal domain-containing protein [Bryobacteraceae bacterium]
MQLEPETCYRALAAHDARFDGCFFVAVSSTRIYCRPVCRVKAPKRQNCSFYPSAATAEAAGYRPCLRCRPELAPGNADVEAGNRIARHAAGLIEEGVGIDGTAKRVGVTARHLSRVFQREFGVSPIAFAQTHRLLLAKRLLADTELPVTEIAFAAGFKSLRRFHALFQERYRLSPRQIRKTPRRGQSRPDALIFNLSYRPPYDWDALLAFLDARSIAGVEEVSQSSYRRIVRVVQKGKLHAGWMEIRPEPGKNVMRVVASVSLRKAIPIFLARVKHVLDLGCHPAQIGERLGALAAAKPGLRVPGAFDGFELAVRAVLGQQVSVAAARTLAGRFAAAFGSKVESPFEALSVAFPLARQVANLEVDDITRLGILPSRARTILALAKPVAQGAIVLRPGSDVSATIEKLQSIAGIGEWTAQYIAMRALAWPDAFPHTDLGIMKALGEKNPKRILAAAEAWRPWRSYAVMHLWAGGLNGGSNGSVA